MSTNAPLRENGHPIEIKKGQVWLTRATGDEYKNRTSVIKIIQTPDEHPDVVGKVLESWNDEKVGNFTSQSPSTFCARMYHREN